MTLNDLDPEEVLYDLLSTDTTVYGRGEPATSGYIIALRDFNLRIGKRLQNLDMDRDLVARWLDSMLPSIGHAETIGSWHDADTGDLHIDVGVIFENKGYALEFAQQQGELAIWDIANAQEIRVS